MNKELTKEECMRTFYRFKHGRGTPRDMVLFEKLINEHFELKEDYQKLLDRKEWYKHEYFGMCDLYEELQSNKI